ncbi:uncharacterized protein LOC124171477 [Ischnura elegans]|uniref:uncharacterized protein LOC124171477 n=1 Tax=Ischnura elegans TaxID=197161 RepID=UPI001ED8BC40|nr:uncharacterized protein LOC124171477 [Ischnura elegans]
MILLHSRPTMSSVTFTFLNNYSRGLNPIITILCFPDKSSAEENEEDIPVEDTAQHEAPLDIDPDPVRVRRHSHADGDVGWSDQDMAVELPVFEEDVGVSATVDAQSDEFDCFSLFFPKEMIKLVKTETNRYAGQCIEKLRRSNKLKPNSLWHKWKPVKLFEMYKFFFKNSKSKS